MISAFANTRDQATTIVPLALVPQLILAGVLVPKLPDLAVAVAKVAVSGYWLTEAMKSVFIAADGPIRVIERAHRRADGYDRETGWSVAPRSSPLHALAFLRPDVRLRSGRPVSQYAGFRGLRRMVRRRASCIGDGSWRSVSPMLALTCTRIRSRSRLAEAGDAGRSARVRQDREHACGLEGVGRKAGSVADVSCGFATRPDRAAMASNGN